jgi:hypothetical protein
MTTFRLFYLTALRRAFILHIVIEITDYRGISLLGMSLILLLNIVESLT